MMVYNFRDRADTRPYKRKKRKIARLVLSRAIHPLPSSRAIRAALSVGPFIPLKFLWEKRQVAKPRRNPK